MSVAWHNAGLVRRRMLAHLQNKGTCITLRWVDFGGAVPDPVTKAMPVAGTPRSEVVKGLVHFVSASKVLRELVELETGDCIVDFPPDICLENRPRLSFEIDGQKWVQKNVGDQAVRMWEAMQGGVRFYRTLVLKKAT